MSGRNADLHAMPPPNKKRRKKKKKKSLQHSLMLWRRLCLNKVTTAGSGAAMVNNLLQQNWNPILKMPTRQVPTLNNQWKTISETFWHILFRWISQSSVYFTNQVLIFHPKITTQDLRVKKTHFSKQPTISKVKRALPFRDGTLF